MAKSLAPQSLALAVTAMVAVAGAANADIVTSSEETIYTTTEAADAQTTSVEGIAVTTEEAVKERRKKHRHRHHRHGAGQVSSTQWVGNTSGEEDADEEDDEEDYADDEEENEDDYADNEDEGDDESADEEDEEDDESADDEEENEDDYADDEDEGDDESADEEDEEGEESAEDEEDASTGGRKHHRHHRHVSGSMVVSGSEVISGIWPRHRHHRHQHVSGSEVVSGTGWHPHFPRISGTDVGFDWGVSGTGPWGHWGHPRPQVSPTGLPTNVSTIIPLVSDTRGPFPVPVMPPHHRPMPFNQGSAAPAATTGTGPAQPTGSGSTNSSAPVQVKPYHGGFSR